MLKKLIILSIFSLFISLQTYATHLIGGNIGYEYIGQFGSNYRFKLILTTYTDCTPASQIPQPENPIQPVGVYTHNVQNDPTGGGNKTLLTTVNVNLVFQQIIEPNQPSNCSVGAGSCIYKGVYEGFVDLPLNFTGYHIVYERCCRNNSIVNLQPEQSMAFYAFISPPLLGNSSPVFTDDPIPFLCVGDTTTILNSAFDPDGDLLTFTFVTPYNGVATNVNPAPAPQNPTLTYPIQNVGYVGGYSTAQPFGPGGYNNINGSTGLTTYFPPSTGDYVVAIEIREFRNGNLIGIMRRDLQLLVLNCPPNPAPVIDPNLGTTNNVFNVEEGETLCFTYGYSDPATDNVTITSSGAIFDPALTNPPATITSPVTGAISASADFCWTTACGQARTAPYQFQISAIDDGCPPNSANNVYEIFVNPVPPPVSISGPQVICQFGNGTYITPQVTGQTYNWTVTGGNIVADNGNSIDIEWTNVGAATVSVSATNQFGCLSSSIEYQTTITPAPAVDAGVEQTICEGESITLSGTTSAGPGFTASWTPNINMTGSTTLTPTVSPTDTTQYTLLIDIGGGCFGIDSVMINVSIPDVEAGVDTTICAGDSIQLQGFVNNGTFAWSPAASLSDPNILNPYASPTTTTTYYLEQTNPEGCIKMDSVIVNVNPSFSLTTSNDTAVCEDNCVTLSVSGATTYAWEPSISLDDSTLSNPLACPIATTTYTVIGFTGVCTDTNQVTVTINNTPSVDAGLDISICEGDTIQLNATGAVDYLWSPNVNISDVTISDPFVSPSATQQYIVTATDISGCEDRDTIVVTVNPLPTADAGEDKGICISTSNGGSVASETLDGTGTGTPIWSPTSGLSDPNIFTPIINPAVDTEYILTVTDGNGCVDTDTVFVTVFDEVPTEAGADTTICPGDTIMIGGNPSAEGANTTYLWSPAGLLDDPTSANPMAFPTVTTMFYLVTNNDTCNGLDSIEITVRSLPNVSAGSDDAICINDTIQLLASGAVDYVWNTQVTLSDSLIDNPLAFPTVTTEYIVTGTDVFGCTNADTIEITVNNLPVVDAGPNDTICIGDFEQLQASGATSYVWSPADSLSDVNIDNPLANPSVTTDYIVTGSDGNLCVNTDTVRIVVNDLPLVDAGNDEVICIGDTIQLLATGAVDYLWSPIADLDDATIGNPLAFNTSTTMFHIMGTDANGCVNVDSVEVSVNLLPIVSAGSDVSICLNDDTQLQASGANSYIWSPTLGLSNATIDNPVASPSMTTEYVVVGTDLNNCSNSDTVEVTIFNLPVVNAGLNDTICLGDFAQLQASGAVSYVWSPTDSLSDVNIDNPIANPSISIDYIVTGTDANLCENTDTVRIVVNDLPLVDAGTDEVICIGDTIPLLATGSVDYVWNPTVDLSDLNIANPEAFNTATTTFFVTGTDANGCVNIDSVEVAVNLLPIVSAGNDVQICIGDSAQLQVSGADTYVWSPATGLSNANISNPMASPGDTTSYVVIGTDNNNCVNSDTIVVIVNPLPTIDAGNDIDICIGGNANLLVSGADTYTWSPSISLNDNSIANPIASPDSTTEYIVVGIDSNSCVNSDTVMVNVFRIQTSPDTAVCPGENVQLNVFGSVGNVYVWTPASELSDATISNPIATPSATTTYFVTVSNIAGCVDQDSVIVSIYNEPTASFDYEIVPACEGVFVEFTNTSIDGISFLWDFNDGVTDTQENTSHTFPYGNSFSTTLTVANAEGCPTTATITDNALTFDDYYQVYIPNVFTPNGDNQNDYFKIEVPGRIYECVDFQIFNRWGQLMFKSMGNYIQWDGRTSTGEICTNGTYMYILDINGKKYSGSLTLFR